MPTYEYECERCNHRFERFQRISEPPLRRCPKCRSMVRRLIGPGGGIIFKGSGFYQTDYRTASYREAAKKEKEATASSSGTEKAAKGDKPSASTKDAGTN